MSDASRQAHWENVYTVKGETELSWFQENPAPSLELIAATGLSEDAAIIDIGGGASLLARKFRQVTVLDLSGVALLAAKERLLVLLRHKRRRFVDVICRVQQGQRGRCRAMATISLRRIVAIEFGM